MSGEWQEYLMEAENYLNVHEAASLLDVSEEELWQLVHKHQVPTHQLAGAFLRFKKEDIEQLKIKWRIERELFPRRSSSFVHDGAVPKATLSDRLADAWYFNDFYILCLVLIMVLLYFIVSSQ